MAGESIYTSTLKHAAAAQGSTQALAHLLHVPESTLLRWMEGRAMMPINAFGRLIEIMSEHERRHPDAGLQDPGRVSFRSGQLFARCARCDGTEFVLVEPGTRLKHVSLLACGNCGERIAHGKLLCQLARDTVQHARAMTAHRQRRQSAT